MPLTKVPFAPGFHKEGTEYSAGASWWGGDKVRFRKGRPEQIGGWQTYPISVKFPVDATTGQVTETYRGIARSLYDWGTSESIKYLGIGTNLKFYVENGGQVYDITPIRSTTAADGVSFDATNRESEIVVTDTDHGAVAGDYVKFTNAVTLGDAITGAVLNHEYVIDSITDTDNYVITARTEEGVEVLADSGDTGDGTGSGVYAEYQINTGTNTYVPSTGYGVGTYGGVAVGGDPAISWGGGGAIGFSGQLRIYSQDAFGDDLVFNPRGGGIYYWDESASGPERGKSIADTTAFPASSDAPILAMQIMVSPIDRHLIAFGVNALGDDDPATATIDPLLIRWSDQESAIDWTPTITNSAGGQVLSTGTRIVGAARARQEILVFTDTSIIAMRYSGAPFVFQFSPIAENASMISPKAAISAGDAVYFMDSEGFYIYQGSVRSLPCEVQDYVFSNLNRDQAYKVYASTNTDKNEVTWHYPVGSGETDITRYVTYNYADGLWTTGTFDRGAWIQAQTKDNPVASSNDNSDILNQTLITQEFNYSAWDDPIGGYIISGHAEIGDGEHMMFIDRMVPDFRFSGNEFLADMTVTILGNKYPMEEMTEQVASEVTYDETQNNVRVRARGIQLKIESNAAGFGWTMGDFRFDMRTDGKR